MSSHCSGCLLRHGEDGRACRRASRSGDRNFASLGAIGHVGCHFCVRLTPLIVTGVPTGPLVGLKLLIVGITRKFILLFRLPPGIVTVTMPVFAPAGTVAVRKVSEDILNVAAVPSNETPVALLNPWPRIPIDFPTLPEVGSSAAYGAKLA